MFNWDLVSAFLDLGIFLTCLMNSLVVTEFCQSTDATALQSQTDNLRMGESGVAHLRGSSELVASPLRKFECLALTSEVLILVSVASAIGFLRYSVCHKVGVWAYVHRIAMHLASLVGVVLIGCEHLCLTVFGRNSRSILNLPANASEELVASELCGDGNCCMEPASAVALRNALITIVVSTYIMNLKAIDSLLVILFSIVPMLLSAIVYVRDSPHIAAMCFLSAVTVALAIFVARDVNQRSTVLTVTVPSLDSLLSALNPLKWLRSSRNQDFQGGSRSHASRKSASHKRPKGKKKRFAGGRRRVGGRSDSGRQFWQADNGMIRIHLVRKVIVYRLIFVCCAYVNVATLMFLVSLNDGGARIQKHFTALSDRIDLLSQATDYNSLIPLALCHFRFLIIKYFYFM